MENTNLIETSETSDIRRGRRLNKSDHRLSSNPLIVLSANKSRLSSKKIGHKFVVKKIFD